jgi:hypothetical protein
MAADHPTRTDHQIVMREHIRRILCAITLLTALAVAAAGCANNKAAQNGWVDHINDGYEDGGM